MGRWVQGGLVRGGGAQPFALCVGGSLGYRPRHHSPRGMALPQSLLPCPKPCLSLLVDFLYVVMLLFRGQGHAAVLPMLVSFVFFFFCSPGLLLVMLFGERFLFFSFFFFFLGRNKKRVS